MPEVPLPPITMQRLGVGAELPGLVTEHGADPRALFAEIGVDLATVSPDLRLPFPMLFHLLHRATEVTGCPHLGVLCGLRFDFRHHGVIGDLMQTAPTLSQALGDYVTWQPGYSSGAIVYLHRTGPDYAFGYGLYTAAAPGAAVLLDTVAAVGCRIISLLTKGAVTPQEILLGRSRPQNGSVYSRLLQVPVSFNQTRTGLVLDRQSMGAAVISADAGRRQAILDRIGRPGRWHGSTFTSRVRHAIRQAMLIGPARMPDIAAELGLGVRTLRRRLEEEVTTFHRLNDEVRHAVARDLLDLTDLPIDEIAVATGFASASVFSETHRRWTGRSPSSLRQERQRPGQDPTAG